MYVRVRKCTYLCGEQRHSVPAAGGAARVEVGVVGRPARHDVLIVQRAEALVALRARRQLHAHRRPLGTRALLT